MFAKQISLIFVLASIPFHAHGQQSHELNQDVFSGACDICDASYTFRTSAYGILNYLFKVTNGNDWNSSRGWGGPDVCDYNGILCEGKKVVRIELVWNALTGSIPSELGLLSDLKSLNLSNNSHRGSIGLTGSIPSELGQLSSLRVLHLDSNSLTGSIPSELGRLSSLKVLQLSGNDLESNIPTQLGQLTNLKHLMLSGNDLTGCVPEIRDYVHVVLDGNALTGIDRSGYVVQPCKVDKVQIPH